MENNLYYTAPLDEQFDELKEKAINIWETMGDEPSYREEKIGRIKDLPNVQGNFMYMVAMFDLGNQTLLSTLLTPATRAAVCSRMIAGGQPPWANPFQEKTIEEDVL